MENPKEPVIRRLFIFENDVLLGALRPMPFVAAFVLWFLSITAAVRSDDAVGAVGIFGLIFLGPVVLSSILYYALRPFRSSSRRVMSALGPLVADAADWATNALVTLAKIAVALCFVAFIIGGIVGLLLIGWRALIR